MTQRQPQAVRTRPLILPAPNVPGGTSSLDCPGAVVIVGANGSGKSRLGAWLELSNQNTGAHIHRVSAQKVLSLPEGVNIQSIEVARKLFLYGTASLDESQSRDYKRGSRWNSRPDTHQLDDYTALLSYLFAEDADVSSQYRQESIVRGPHAPPPAKLDAVRRIFDTVLAHRRIFASGGQVMVEPTDTPDGRYNASQMSDGERVVFYLAGACMSAPAGAIVIIDEPEIHLHKSVQGLLWDALERERPDCLFVYLTHDLEFAASRVGAVKVWLRGYRPAHDAVEATWDWAPVPEQDQLPEPLLLQLLGSRRPVLFTEGERGGLDDKLFTALLPGYAVTPVGSCEQVIHITQSFANMKDLHHLECRGVVDRDARDQEDVDYLRQRGIHTLEVSEIENLFLLEPLLRAVAVRVAVNDVEAAITRIKGNVLGRLNRERLRIASALTAVQIEKAFKTFNAKAQGADELEAALRSVTGGVDVQALFQVNLARIDHAVQGSDFDAALALYNNKGLTAEVASVFAMKLDRYQSICLDRLADPAEQTLQIAMRARSGGW